MEGSRRPTKYVLNGRGWIHSKKVRCAEERPFCSRDAIALPYEVWLEPRRLKLRRANPLWSLGEHRRGFVLARHLHVFGFETVGMWLRMRECVLAEGVS